MTEPLPSRLGRRVVISTAGERAEAFVPPPLPPDPPVRFGELQVLLGQAHEAVGRLDGIRWVLPDPEMFLYMYVRKEALLSSQIEGTQSSLSELLRFENENAPGAPENADVIEVSNYVAAMNHGLGRMRAEKGLPVSSRLIREVHTKLLSRGRGSTKLPGRFRTSQNWIGGTRPGNATHVPPPHEDVPALMSDLEDFLHEDAGLPPLVKAALAHVQFETIHPFLDGNGRAGRLLITLYLCECGVLAEPLLYLSLHFKTHRAEYYDRLTAVRRRGDWEGWLRFFLEGVVETCRQATETARRLLRLFEEDRKRIEADRPTSSSIRLHRLLQRRALVSAPWAAQELAVSSPTANSALSRLERLGIISEITGRKWGRMFAYKQYLNILEEGTKPID